MKKIVEPVKNFVIANKKTLAVGAVLGTVIVLQQKGIRGLNEFLGEHNLLEEYYHEDVML